MITNEIAGTVILIKCASRGGDPLDGPTAVIVGSCVVRLIVLDELVSGIGVCSHFFT